MSDEVVFVLLLRGTLLTPLMARNALKSNVTWSSYPFLPPTSASGCLAELVGQRRWHEGNSLGLDGRRLQEVPGYQDVFALGGYPSQGQMSRRHFRSHLGSIFNYEAAVWSAGRNEGKKLAVVEEMLADDLNFVVASNKHEPLIKLHRTVRGRLAPLAKKGSLQLRFFAEPEIFELSSATATGQEETVALMCVKEMGSLPQRPLPPGQALVHYVPTRSRVRESQMQWDVMPCIWEERMKFRAGISIFAGQYERRSVGLSREVWDRICEPWLDES